ncbi:Translation initiation factor 3 subunit J component [Sorochytrium milnesiophthora]
MSDWEDYAEDVAPAAPAVTAAAAAAAVRSKWDDEDAEVSVKESWEDSDEDSGAKKPAAGAAGTAATAASRKKKSLNQAIAERKAEEDRKRKELAEKRAQEEARRKAEGDETPAQRRARQQREIEAADAKNIDDLFGNVAIRDEDKPVVENPLTTLKPKTMEDFNNLTQALLSRFSEFESQALYVAFLESFCKSVCDKLKADDIRKISSSLNALFNEKQRAEKEAGKKKKGTKAKAQVRVEKGDEGEDDDFADAGRGYYGNDLDDFSRGGGNSFAKLLIQSDSIASLAASRSHTDDDDDDASSSSSSTLIRRDPSSAPISRRSTPPQLPTLFSHFIAKQPSLVAHEYSFSLAQSASSNTSSIDSLFALLDQVGHLALHRRGLTYDHDAPSVQPFRHADAPRGKRAASPGQVDVADLPARLPYTAIAGCSFQTATPAPDSKAGSVDGNEQQGVFQVVLTDSWKLRMQSDGDEEDVWSVLS